MKLGLSSAAESLSTHIAYERPRDLALLERWWLSIWVFGFVEAFGGRSSFNLVERLVLVVLQPLQSALHWRWVRKTYF
jgi:hypothetical protein